MSTKMFFAVLVTVLVSAFLVVEINFHVTRAMDYGSLGTTVGGIIWDNTTWTLENSPYTITDTVQIPENVTLTIEPGVTVLSSLGSYDEMFLFHGVIRARGTVDNKIVFDGGGNSNFFNVDGSNDDTFLDLDYCIIRNGLSFWWGEPGHFNLTHSELTDLTDYSYIWYPRRDIHIEHNKFVNTGGFSVGHNYNVKVYIRYNLFKEKNPDLPAYADFCIQNWASYITSETSVRYNSFIDMDGIVLELPEGYDSAAMTATENYWGTNDTDAIDSMIYDKNDDINCAGFIEYLPILTEPHSDTPILLEDIEGEINGSSKKDGDGKWRWYANLTIRNHSHKNITIYWVYLNAINITYVDETFEELDISENVTINYLIQPEQDMLVRWNVTTLGFTKEPKALWVIFKAPILEAYGAITQTRVIPEFPSFLILPLFMTATLITVMVHRRKHTTKH